MQLQVDTTYFSRAASPTPVTAPPKKKPRTSAAPIEQVPVTVTVQQDLATPLQLQATSDQNAPQPTSSAVLRPILPADETTVLGSKRPADTDGTSTSARAPKPQQPHKRQKAQASLFIPKKRT